MVPTSKKKKKNPTKNQTKQKSALDSQFESIPTQVQLQHNTHYT